MTGPDPRTSATRFPVAVDAALREAGWEPGRWDMRQAEVWADTLRAYVSPGGHEHAVLPAAVEVWAEFGTLYVAPGGPGGGLAPSALRVDPLHGLHAARTFGDLGRAIGAEVCPLGAEVPPRGVPGEETALLAIDAEGRVYGLDHAGDWYLGHDFDAALTTLITGAPPTRLTVE